MEPQKDVDAAPCASHCSSSRIPDWVGYAITVAGVLSILVGPMALVPIATYSEWNDVTTGCVMGATIIAFPLMYFVWLDRTLRRIG